MSAILDVEDPIADKYNLEVSSPGLDRPLFTLEQFQRYVGEDIAVHLRIPVLDRRKWQGKLEKIENDMLTLIVDGQEQVLIFGNIQKSQCNRKILKEKKEMSKEILLAAEAVSNEKLFHVKRFLKRLESAIALSTKKKYDYETDIRVSINTKTGEFDTFRRWLVVDEVKVPTKEMTLEAAQF